MAADWVKHEATTTSCIDVNDPVALQHWAKELGVPERELRKAVIDAGVSEQRVREWLLAQ